MLFRSCYNSNLVGQHKHIITDILFKRNEHRIQQNTHSQRLLWRLHTADPELWSKKIDLAFTRFTQNNPVASGTDAASSLDRMLERATALFISVGDRVIKRHARRAPLRERDRWPRSLQKLWRTARRARKRFQRHGIDKDAWDAAELAFDRAKPVELARQATEDAERITSNSRDMWRRFKRLSGETRNSTIPTLHIDRDTLATSDAAKAEALATAFASVSKEQRYVRAGNGILSHRDHVEDHLTANKELFSANYDHVFEIGRAHV